jgi:F-type H+-transporting ATPase subunit epsilon
MYHLFMATPDKVFFDGEANDMTAPGTIGYLEILTDHAPIITTLKPGRLSVTDKEGKKWVWAISRGYLNVNHNQATLLADAAELPSEIDLKRAEAALERAAKWIESTDPKAEIPRAKKAYARAENRIKIAKESH